MMWKHYGTKLPGLRMNYVLTIRKKQKQYQEQDVLPNYSVFAKRFKAFHNLKELLHFSISLNYNVTGKSWINL